jgi:hypothetical protein
MRQKIKGVKLKIYKKFWYVQDRIKKGLKVRKSSLKFFNKYKDKIQIKPKIKKIKEEKKEENKTFIIKGSYNEGDINHTIDYEIQICSDKIKTINEASNIAKEIIKKAVSYGYPLDVCNFEVGIENKVSNSEVKIRGVVNHKLTQDLRRLV